MGRVGNKTNVPCEGGRVSKVRSGVMSDKQHRDQNMYLVEGLK